MIRFLYNSLYHSVDFASPATALLGCNSGKTKKFNGEKKTACRGTTVFENVVRHVTNFFKTLPKIVPIFTEFESWIGPQISEMYFHLMLSTVADVFIQIQFLKKKTEMIWTICWDVRRKFINKFINASSWVGEPEVNAIAGE